MAHNLLNKIFAVDSMPLFSNLSSLKRRFAASKCQLLDIEKDRVIYNEDDPPDYFYCVVNGRIELYHPAEKTKRRQKIIMEAIARGDYFGSISALTGQPHTVSARALNDSTVLRFRRKDFNDVLKKIPELAIFITRSLSKRLRRKPLKDIFESRIIAVFGMNAGSGSSAYAAALAAAMKRESRKKILLLKSSSIKKKKDVAPRISSFTSDYHYVLVDVTGGGNDVNLEILRQADECHIVCASDRPTLDMAAAFIKRLEGSFIKHSRQEVFVILKEDGHFAKTSYDEKAKVLGKDVFGTLSRNRQVYKKAIRRIAREITASRIGLALGSGAAMGLAHIGVLKVLEEEKIPVDIIAGTSIGALVAALWAAGHSAKRIERIALKFKSRLSVFFLLDPTLPAKGLIKGKAVRKFLEPYLGAKTFYDIKVPLKIVACDVRRRREVVIDKGRLIDACMASIAIPGVFEPFESDNTQLVDGGIINPVPVSVLSRLGVKNIIAVNTLPSEEDVLSAAQKKLNIYDIIVSSFQAMEYTIAEHSCQQADVYLHPIPQFADWYELYKAKAFIKTGYEYARRSIGEIRRLAH